MSGQLTPKFRDVGTIDLIEVEPGRWQFLLTAHGADASPYGTYLTEGAALEAAKAWARQRGLRTTWATLTLRQAIR